MDGIRKCGEEDKGALASHVLAEAKRLGATRVEIGIIAEHTELKEWYEKFGFIETAAGRFPTCRLPLALCQRD